MSDRNWPEYPFPCWDGKDDLYLVQAAGTWPLYASTSKGHAIADYERLMKGNRLGRVHIWRVTAIEVEELAVQREIVREELVPKGTEVKS